jgi:hypothetical protein
VASAGLFSAASEGSGNAIEKGRGEHEQTKDSDERNLWVETSEPGR